MLPPRSRLIIQDQDPNAFKPFSRLHSGMHSMIYPHPSYFHGVSKVQAINTVLALISSVLDESALLNPPLLVDDLIPSWPLLYPYTTNRQQGGCMQYNLQKVRTLNKLAGDKRLWRSPKRSLPYLELKLGYGERPKPSKKRPSIITSVHRLVYWIFKGPIGEKGGLVLHRCGNHACFNPNHLEEGDHKQNYLDWALM
jgi:HNH endonuclease